MGRVRGSLLPRPAPRGVGGRLLKIAIIGGGVGGLTAALALARKGVDVEVYEQSPTLSEVGASLQLGPNAVRLVHELGVLPGLREIGVRPDAVEFVRWDDGSLLLRAGLGDTAEEYFGAPELDFFRPELQRALFEALSPGVVRMGRRVESIEQDDDSVRLLLAGGASVEADAAVAADGIRSAIRQQLVGPDDPVFSGTVVYRGVVPREEVVELHPNPVNVYWLGPGRHGVVYWVAAGRLLAVNCAVQDADWSRESWTLEAPVDETLSFFEGWHGPLLDRIRRVRTMLRGAVFVRRPLEQWSFRRVTLLGDAAHAMEPFQAQGAAQAVEDAYVLGECVGTSPDVVEALSRYEGIRIERGHAVQASSSGAANTFYLPDGPDQSERDARYATLHETLPFGPRQPIWEYDVRDALLARREA